MSMSNFEVGDQVVLVPFSGDFSKNNDALYDILDFENDLKTLAILSDRKGGEVRSSTQHLRFATNEEFAAGKRLNGTLNIEGSNDSACSKAMTRSEFEKSKTFKYYYSTLIYFDEGLNLYASKNSLRNEDAKRLTAAWWSFEEQQTKLDLYRKKEEAINELISELKEQSEALHHRWHILGDSVALAEAEMIDMCIKEIKNALNTSAEGEC